MLKGVILTVNYPDTSVDAAIPDEMTPDQLASFIRTLIATEPDATSFTVAAVIQKTK